MLEQANELREAVGVLVLQGPGEHACPVGGAKVVKSS
jgi:hypothetical protein